MPTQYKIQRGDNLIKIARKYGLNSLDEILALNPNIKDPNLIYTGQVINLPDKEYFMNMPESVVTAEMPEQYRSGKVAAYGQALMDHKINLNKIPKEYQADALKYSMNRAKEVFGVELLTHGNPWSMAYDLARGIVGTGIAATSKEGRKDLYNYFTGNYSEPTRSDYYTPSEIVFDNGSIFGKTFEKEHPVLDVAGNVIVGALSPAIAEGVIVRSIDGVPIKIGGNVIKNMSNNAKGTAYAMGIKKMTPASDYRALLRAASKRGKGKGKGKVVGGAEDIGTLSGKGNGKTGTVSRISFSGKSKANVSQKGTVGHRASFAPKPPKPQKPPKQPTVVKEPVLPVGGYEPIIGIPPLLATPKPVTYIIDKNPPVQKEEHYEATWENPNPMIWNTKPTIQVPYREGMEKITHNEGKAAKTGSKKERITKEELRENIPGRVQENVVIVPGPWYGNPSQWYIQDGRVYKDKFGGILKRTK